MDKIIAIYSRESSGRSDLSVQQTDLKRWADEHAGHLHIEWFYEKSANTLSRRPQWKRIEDLIDKHQIDRIIVWQLHRLGHSPVKLLNLFRRLTAANINLIGVREEFNLLSPDGRLVVNMLARLCQYETEIHGEQIRDGQAIARQQGKKWGGDSGQRVSKVTPTCIGTMRDLLAENKSVTEVARSVSLSRQSVYVTIEKHKLPYKYRLPKRRKSVESVVKPQPPVEKKPEPRTLEQLRKRCAADPTAVFLRLARQYSRNSG